MAQNPNDPKIIEFYRQQRERAEAEAAQGSQSGARMAGQIYQKRTDADAAQHKYATDDATQAARYQAQSMAPGMVGKALGAGAELAGNPAALGSMGGDIGQAIQQVAPRIAQVLTKLGMVGSARTVMQEGSQIVQRGRTPMGGPSVVGAQVERGGAEAGGGETRALMGGAPKKAASASKSAMKNVTPKKASSSAAKSVPKSTAKSAPTRAAKAAKPLPGRAIHKDAASVKAPRTVKAAPTAKTAMKSSEKGTPANAKFTTAKKADNATVAKSPKRGAGTTKTKTQVPTEKVIRTAPTKKPVSGRPSSKPLEGKSVHKDAGSVKPRRTGKLAEGARAKTRGSEKSEPANTKMRGTVARRSSSSKAKGAGRFGIRPPSRKKKAKP
jgi:hypothetical protein